jgi:hypothetical protein
VKRFASALALALCAGVAGAQTVTITDVGPGESGRILRNALRRPHRLAEPDSQRLVITREVQVRGALIVLGRNVLIEGAVDGDVIVVGGDLFVRAGAQIGGRAIAIGGGAYPSALAVVTGGTETFRDNTFDITRVADGYRLAWRSTEPPKEPPLLFPDVYGLRMPSYDRVNGLSLRFGPAVAFGADRGRVDLLGTYRSQLGEIDPSIRASFQLSRRTRLTLDARRGSFSNEDWIWLDWVNSGSVLVFGDDTRNFYRGNKAELMVYRLWEGENIRWEPFIGFSAERDWSVGPPVVATGGPWSLMGRTDTLSMWRPNPAISSSKVFAALVGTSMHWDSDGLSMDARTRLEIAGTNTPLIGFFAQATTDVSVSFPTFGEQSYGADVHIVKSFADQLPKQRYVYLGGSGTLPFHEMLSFRGDELLLIDQRYSIPLTGVRLGDFGNPSLQLRHRIAGAWFGGTPSSARPRLETMLGFGVAVVFVRGEVQVNPATGKARLAAGFTFSR